jgi:hypothetical protein
LSSVVRPGGHVANGGPFAMANLSNPPLMPTQLVEVVSLSNSFCVIQSARIILLRFPHLLLDHAASRKLPSELLLRPLENTSETRVVVAHQAPMLAWFVVVVVHHGHVFLR